uniref:Putative secreted protein n=1 Tax=Anopheles darlingi TaxID=43151 RepID=A0A2M4D1L0_ANODA
MRNMAACSLFSSIARCSSVCRHPSGPGPQQSVSTPCRTSTEAISCWSDSSALHSGQSPLLSGALNDTPRLQSASTTSTSRQWMASCSGDS